MGIILLFIVSFEIINDSLVFQLDSHKVEILSLDYVGPPLTGYEGTEPKIVGEVKNVGKEVIIGLRVELTAYGVGMKTLVDKRDREIAFWVLEPQKTSPFCIYLTGCVKSGDEIKAVKIELIEQESMKDLLEISQNNSIYDGLEIANVGVVVETTLVYEKSVTYSDKVVNHYICGRIVNSGERTTKSNAVVALFYDESGKLIDYRKHNIFGAFTGGELSPGDVRIFRLDVPKEVIGYKNYTYKLKLFSVAK